MSAYLNQEIISDAKFDSLTRSSIKNKKMHGVFETMHVAKSHGVLHKKRHLERLLRGVESIKAETQAFDNLDLTVITDYFEQDMKFFQSWITENQSSSVALRFQIILDENNPKQIMRMLITRSSGTISSGKVKIKICTTVLTEDSTKQGRKDIDRRIYDKAAKEFDKKFYDGILCDQHGHVIEGTKTNIFAIKESTLFTPSLVRGGVAGIMRQIVIEKAQGVGLNIIIAPLHYLELVEMDAVFITNSIIGLVKVDYVLRPDRQRSTNVFKPRSKGFQNILKLKLLKNDHLYKRIKS